MTMTNLASFIKKTNNDAWHTILAAGTDRNIVVYDSAVGAQRATPSSPAKINAETKQVQRRLEEVMPVKFYIVGGFVRDRILGVKSKDVDYSVEAPSYQAMKDEILRRGGEIFLETPQYLTIRARMPELGAADFVLCRKDGSYIDGRRPEEVEPGTLYDDLARRDFTMNAIAMTEDGVYIDPFCGQDAIKRGEIVCVGDTKTRFGEDYLRMLRAIRFCITKDMNISVPIGQCLRNPVLVNNLQHVAIERVREELLKCFHHNTPRTLNILSMFPYVLEQVFMRELWLKPTLEK